MNLSWSFFGRFSSDFIFSTAVMKEGSGSSESSSVICVFCKNEKKYESMIPPSDGYEEMVLPSKNARSVEMGG